MGAGAKTRYGKGKCGCQAETTRTRRAVWGNLISVDQAANADSVENYLEDRDVSVSSEESESEATASISESVFASGAFQLRGGISKRHFLPIS